MADIIIKGGHILTMDPHRRLIKGGAVVISDGKILSVGEETKEKADTVIDASGKVVLPGLINCHTHLAMTLLRGVADDMELMPWLKTTIWPLEKHLTAERVYAGALLGCLEMIKSGTTCFADNYFFMDETANAVEKSGIRGDLSHGIIEHGDPKKRESELRIGEQLVKDWHGKAGGRLTTRFGPHAPYTCSPECLTKVKELAKKHKVGIHIHVAESQDETKQITEKYGKRPVEHLDSIGFLGPEILAAHCVWLNEKEIKVLHARGVKPVHNPVSNMKIGCGVSPVPEMLKAGIPVALGTDGAASNNSLDMINEMKFAALLNKVHKLDPTVMSAYSVLEMATINGAKALRLEKEIGSIEVGKKADIIIVDLHKPHLTPAHNVVSHLVYSAVGEDVDTTIVDGKILMKGRKVLTLEEENVIEKAQEASDSMVKEAEK
ncbi:MAG: amidohydrolase family protein [Candidatus Hadarchaeota archaeon]